MRRYERPQYRYLTDCVHSTGAAVRAVIEQAIEVTRRTFLQHVDRVNLREIEARLGYAAHPRQGLTMARDYHVSYHRSKFQGKRCYYFSWSGIEHIFTQDAADDGLLYGGGDV